MKNAALIDALLADGWIQVRQERQPPPVPQGRQPQRSHDQRQATRRTHSRPTGRRPSKDGAAAAMMNRKEASMSSIYTIFIERSESGTDWSAWSPDLNVYATGETREAAIEQAKSAIAFHLDGLREMGEPIPAPSAEAVTVEAA
jgi:predicted RNase H-like HicB family nuclease